MTNLEAAEGLERDLRRVRTATISSRWRILLGLSSGRCMEDSIISGIMVVKQGFWV
jgi:hypothetical protein